MERDNALNLLYAVAMANLKLILLFILLVIALGGCGTLQVGFETTATPAPVPAATMTNTASTSPTNVVATPTNIVPTSIPTGPVAASPTAALVRINFPVGGTNFSFPTRLTKGIPERYVLQVMAQQKMTITTSRNVTVEVLDTHSTQVSATANQPGQWQGTIPHTADYIIVLRGDGFINVSIDIPPPG